MLGNSFGVARRFIFKKLKCGGRMMGDPHYGLNSREVFHIICYFLYDMVIVFSIHPSSLEPDLAQFLTVDAASWGMVAQEVGAEALREICASIKWDYGPDVVLTEMQAQEMLNGVSIGLYYPPFHHFNRFSTFVSLSASSYIFSKFTFSGISNDAPC